MAFARSSLPVLTTSLPPNGSSSSSSSPLTPFSELGPEYNTLRSRLTTPTTTPDVPKPCTSYITYPEPAVPPRQLTPPPKSRFVPLFESISKAANSPTDLSRRGSLGDDEASPIAPPISLPFSSAVTTQMRKRLSLTSNHMSIEPTLKSAPLSGSSFGNSPWTRHCALSASADILHDHLSHTEQLNDVIRSLRHQLNVKTHRLHTAEAEVARLSSAYASLADEKAKLVEDYAHARARIDDLEAKICAEERCTFRRDIRDSHQTTSQSRRSLTREPRTPIWAMDHGKRGVTPLDSEAKEEQVPADEKDNSPPALSVSAEAYQSVLTRIPEMPSDVIVASLAEVFLSPDFDFLQWLGTNGLQLPESAKLLADLSWEDRLRLGAGDLDRLGVRSASDRSYIMRVLKAIAKGEAPHLHPSLIGPGFTEAQYVTIMREQRIDKHVPNLSGIPWPIRLFVDEEDLIILQVQKAGARGTIMTVFSGLRKGGPRPEPRPRRGTKKSKRAKQEAAAATGAEDNGHTEDSLFTKPSTEKRGSNIKISLGRQGPRMAPSREKGALAPAHSHPPSDGHSSSWFGHQT